MTAAKGLRGHGRFTQFGKRLKGRNPKGTSIEMLESRRLFSTTIFSEDLESYAAGSNLVGQGGWIDTFDGDSVITVNPSTLMGTEDDPTQVIDGHALTGLGRENVAEHPVSIDPDLVTTIQFRAYAPAIAHNQELAVDEFGPGVNERVLWGVDSGLWFFGAGEDNGNFPVPGGFDDVVTLGIVLDGPADEVYGIYDFGGGFVETPHYVLSDARSATLNAIHLYVDHRGDPSRAIQIDDILVTEESANQDPTLTVPGAKAAFEDVAKAVDGISVGDADGDDLTVTLEVNHGTLTLADTTGLTATGNVSDSVSLSGSVADLNASLGTLSYLGNSNFSGVDTLSITVDDGTSNDTSGTVTIVVKSAAQQAADLQAQVNALFEAGVLKKGQANALNVKLNLGRGNDDLGNVQSFAKQVKAFRQAGILSESQANVLLDQAGILLLSLSV